MRLYDSYIICATPRTGSTLLCDLLTSTGAAGRPDSYFRQQIIDWWAQHLNVSVPQTATEQDFNRAYMEAVMCEGEAGTGIFGLRLMMENVGELSDRLGTLHPGIASDAARFEKAIGKTLYIHLSRKDMVAQAVSLAKAMQTGLWHIAPDGAELERMAPPQTPKYDANLIKQNIAAFVRFDEDWNRWFDQQGINPVRVSYEALSDNPPAVLKDILEHLGLNPTLASGIMPGVAKLADTQSAEWIRRYRSESNYSGPR